MIAAIIQNGIVANLVVVAHLGVLPGQTLVDGAGAAIGDTWDGTHFIKPTPPAETPEQAREKFKAARAALVAAIVVSVDGLPFDGDEDSQNRMARAVLVAQIAGLTSTIWTLANNTAVEVTVGQLQQALTLAGLAQSDVWVAP